MDQIYETNDKFMFNQLHISKPLSSSAGVFISKYAMNEHPLYIQPPKCTIKQIVTKTGKRMYCDLVFHQENEQFIQWMENLENASRQMIYDNREKWFQTELEMDDIENSFTSPIKIYKSGKSYIVRTHIQTGLGKPVLKVYDEDERDVSYDQLKEGTQVMVILEVQGIRCSSRSFQIDIEVKQMMVIKPTNLFNTCILKKKIQTNEIPIVTSHIDDSVVMSDVLGKDEIETETEIETMDTSIPSVDIPSVNEVIEENITIKIDTDMSNNNELCEVDLSLDEIPESEAVSIKQRNDVYYKMYQEAREKAKIARDLALSAYLEAKRIKNTYMLEDIIDSSDDSDDEEDEETNSDNDE